MIESIFFDFDGVLTTDHRASITIGNNIKDIVPHRSVDEIIGCYREVYDGGLYTGAYSHADRWNDFCTSLGEEISLEAMLQVLRKVPANTEVINIAKQLSTRHTVGIITDNDSERVRLILDDLQLTSLFNPVIVSADVQCSKFDGTTKIFDFALEKAGITAKSSAFIDNKEKNLSTPKQMGIATYWHDDSANNVQALQNQLMAWGCVL